MSSLKQTIAIFTKPSSKAMQSISFQGCTLFNPIITTPLSIEIPHVGPHAQPKLTIPKLKLKRGTKIPTTKKPKTTPIVQILNLTNEAGQLLFSLPIVEDNPPSTSTPSLGSQSLVAYGLHL